MKTIQQIAEEIGVSKATVYNRLKSSNISLTDLPGRKIKNKRLFDEEAEAIIKGLFVQDASNSPDFSKQSNTVEQSNDLVKELDKTREELKNAQAEIERLRGIEEQLHKQITDLIETQKADKMLLLQQQTNIKLLEAPKTKEGILTKAKHFLFGEKKAEG